jgi:hypothetical protein
MTGFLLQGLPFLFLHPEVPIPADFLAPCSQKPRFF